MKEPGDLFAWFERNSFKYAVLRGYHNMGEYPQRGGKADFDLLIEPAAVAPLRSMKPVLTTRKGRGFKCDFNISYESLEAVDWKPYCLLPGKLSEAVLHNRQRCAEGFFVPAARDLYDALIYHIVYQQAEKSGASAFVAADFKRYKRYGYLQRLAAELGEESERTLLELHDYLRAKGYHLPYALAVKYVQSQFAHGLKSEFFAHLFKHDREGEMNLFVLRGKAVSKGLTGVLLSELKKHYTVLNVKKIPWLVRIVKSRYMRGNKWRWGGRPAVAVVVFDPHPHWRSEAERQECHPLVFNSTQFFKPELRRRITKEHGMYYKHNVLHSTDNEAEALGHLNLFYTPAEEETILGALATARAALSSNTARRSFGD